MAHYSIRKRARRRKVAFIASQSMKYTVNNNTIPQKVDTPAQWDGGKWYKEAKEKRISYLASTYSGKYANKDDVSYGFKRRKLPWYVLTKGKCYNYQEVKHKWGSETKPVRVKSEQKVFHDLYTIKKMNHIEYMEALVQYKLKKWEKKNPCPIDIDPKQHDLFEAEFLPTWKFQRDQAEERIRNFVVSIYDKLDLTGRYKKADNVFKEKLVAKIKDEDGEGHIVNELDPKKSKLLKKAKIITNKEKKKNPKLVATNLKDHKRKKGRIILPDAA